jgi:hypothetical protein
MKLRSMRGPNWVEVSVSATITIENTTPITVITAVAIAVSTVLATSGEPLITQPGTRNTPSYAARSSA